MRSLISCIVGGILIASPTLAEPTEVFGGEFAIADGLAGFTLDVNADGVFDVNFGYYGISVNSIFAWNAIVQRASVTADTLFATSTDDNKSTVHFRFVQGDTIGPDEVDGASFGDLAYEIFFDGTCGGPWLDQEIGYVGFSFLSDIGRHYGWAELRVDNSKNTDDGFLVLYRVGYETVPGVSIEAGAPFGCNPADLTGDGVLNFFDVSAFLSAFSKGDPVADFTGDGVFNFFDVSAFLGEFAAGCP